MKKLLIIILVGWSSMATAQVPGMNFGAEGASLAMEPELITWAVAFEPKMVDAMKRYSAAYIKRNVYYTQTFIDQGDVAKDAVRALQTRSADLRLRNDALGPFYPYTKRDNRMLLNVIDDLLQNVMDQFANLDIDRIAIYGERINLNQNTRMSMEKLSRELDKIESKSDRSTTINLLRN